MSNHQHQPNPTLDQSVGVEVTKSDRGEVIKCRMCNNAALPLPLRQNCTFCFTRGFVVVCLNCEGEGLVGGGNVWGGKGKGSDYKSPCNKCGGKGTIPATKEEAEMASARMKEREEKLKEAASETEPKDDKGNKDENKGESIQTPPVVVPPSPSPSDVTISQNDPPSDPNSPLAST